MQKNNLLIGTKMEKENIIKSKKRVQQHGEVLTPKSIVKKMLDTPEIKEATMDLETTFLEPGAGEGAFLMEILHRKLKMVLKKYNNSLLQYENYSLFALTTIYGVELLEDNSTICVLNLYEIFKDYYVEAALKHNKKIKNKVLDSAKIIIRTNIVLGNFLTRMDNRGREIVFTEWKPENLKNKTILIDRTEYTFDEIINKAQKETGEYINGYSNYENSKLLSKNQISFINISDNKEIGVERYKYKKCKITDVYMELMEEIFYENDN